MHEEHFGVIDMSCSFFLTFLKIYLIYIFWPLSMWDLSSPTRDETQVRLQWKPQGREASSRSLDCRNGSSMCT